MINNAWGEGDYWTDDQLYNLSQEDRIFITKCVNSAIKHVLSRTGVVCAYKDPSQDMGSRIRLLTMI